MVGVVHRVTARTVFNRGAFESMLRGKAGYGIAMTDVLCWLPERGPRSNISSRLTTSSSSNSHVCDGTKYRTNMSPEIFCSNFTTESGSSSDG